MKTLVRQTRLFIAVASLLVLFLPGCKTKSLTAAEILSQATQKMGDVKSLAMEMNITIQASGTNLIITGEGVTERPDKAYLKMSVMGQTIEVVTKSETEVYLRQAGSTTWEQVSADEIEQVGINIDLFTQMKIDDIAEDPKLAGSEKVNGTDCYKLTFDVNLENYLQGNGQIIGVAIDPASTKATGEAWVGKNDSLLRKLDIQLTTTIQGISAKIGNTATFSEFNQPVDIPEP